MSKYGLLASKAGYRLPIEVLQSAAGYYIGTIDNRGPVSRESVEYFETQRHALEALAMNNWTQRDHP
jgi:hypothetical protein